MKLREMNPSNAVGIVGYRSWIAAALMARIKETTAYHIHEIDKDYAADYDSTGLACVFIIPGRLDVDQMDADRLAERELVRGIAASERACRHLVMLSSNAVFEDTAYGRHKMEVEHAFLDGAQTKRERDGREVIATAVRPGAIFGPGQDLNSPMLIPSIVRMMGQLTLLNPDEPRKFIPIRDLCDHLIREISSESPWPVSASINGTFVATPRQLLSLHETFVGMRPRG